MLFIWLIEGYFLVKFWIFLLIIEYHNILWVFEYEIERFKATIVIHRISAWFAPYKLFSKFIFTRVNKVEHIFVNALRKYFSGVFFHLTQFFFSALLLYNNSYVWLFSTPLMCYLLRYIPIPVLFLRDGLVWWRVSQHNFNFGSWFDSFDKSKLKKLDLSNPFIHDWDGFKNPFTIELIWIFDTKESFKNAIKNAFKKQIKILFNIHLNFSKYIITLISLFIFSAVFYTFNVFFYFSIFKNIWLYLIIIIFMYLLISTFFHFSKTYAVNKYTSQTQRFWKRTFGVFWGLEFTLFAIYMYLTLISPAELAMYAINYKEIITGLNIIKNCQYHIFYFFALVILNFLFVCLVFLKKKDNFHFFKLILLLINFLYCYIIYYEFLKLYYMSGWGTHTTHTFCKSFTAGFEYNNIISDLNNPSSSKTTYFKVPNTLNNTWNDVSNEKQWVRTFRHFIYVTVLLKFWHILFIYIYFSLSLWKFIETNYMSFDVISSNHQNAIYVIWFYLLSYLLIVKKKFYFLITTVYYWSFVNVNFMDFIYSFLAESNLTYLF